MSEQVPDEPTDLDDGDREAIADVCERHKFPFADAALDGDVLKLTPTSLDDLPDAETLEAIAGALEDDRFQYVTFAVPEADAEETSK